MFVGLSGGVDSSVSAALLKEAGYDVTGVFIRVWQPDFFECTWKDDRLDAMRICAKLEIPFIELNLEKEYKKEVVDYMIREYRAGKTPNPDVFCNRFIKFGGFYKFARKSGADFIATGHYARAAKTQSTVHKDQKRLKVQNSKLTSKRYILKAGSDTNKDQSYFLWQIRKVQLPHIIFPIGKIRKVEVRKLAKKFGLITADKKDSQGLCFIGKVDMKEFLSHYIHSKAGDIVDEEGSVVGQHSGAFFYTLGERIPVDLVSKGGNARASKYVVKKSMSKNTLTVSSRLDEGQLPDQRKEVLIRSCNWFIAPKRNMVYRARVRYRQPLQKCRVDLKSKTRAKVKFDRAQSSVTPGQSVVIYDVDTVVGGGIIV